MSLACLPLLGVLVCRADYDVLPPTDKKTRRELRREICSEPLEAFFSCPSECWTFTTHDVLFLT